MIGSRVYKDRNNDLLEIFLYFNILAVVTFTWITIDADEGNTIYVALSVGVTLCLFVFVTVLSTMTKPLNLQRFKRWVDNWRLRPAQAGAMHDLADRGAEIPELPYTTTIIDLN